MTTNEYELKFLNVELKSLRISLEEQRYVLTKPETLMRRQTYHLPKDHPEFENKWGRVRDEGDKITATVKWYDDPVNPSISDVHEREVTVGNWNEGEAWIQSQGFTPTAYQENTREAWKKNEIEIAIDTWPGLSPYVEIEGQSEQDVTTAAKNLGFDPTTGVAGGSEIVYQLQLGIPAKTLKALPRITFECPPAAQTFDKKSKLAP